jgi:DNA polymerase
LIRVFLDLETRSKVSIKKGGVYKYAADPSAKVLLLSYAVNDDEPHVLDCAADPRALPAFAAQMRKLSEKDHTIFTAHNAVFDRTFLMYQSVSLPSTWECTKCLAYRSALPGALDDLCTVLGLPVSLVKMKEGKDLIQLFCVPHKTWKNEWATEQTHPEQWQTFKAYALQDVVALREVYNRLPKWNDNEFEKLVEQLDQVMSDRGFAVDVPLARAAVAMAERAKGEINATITEMTDGAVLTANQRDRFLLYFREAFGLDLPDLSKSSVRKCLQSPSLPPECKQLLEQRASGAKNSVSKYQAILEREVDGRIHGALQYGGAPRTLRWAGSGFQPQNIPRLTISPEELRTRIHAVLDDSVGMLYSDTLAVLSSIIRGAITPKTGCKIVVADLSAIEGKTLAWFCGAEAKLALYRAGVDVYSATYAQIFGKDIAEVTKDERQIGKVAELALGYAGGVSAVLVMAETYKVDLQKMAATVLNNAEVSVVQEASTHYAQYGSEQLDIHEDIWVACETVKLLWRKHNAYAPNFWNAVKTGIEHVLRGDIRQVETHHIMIDRVKAWLRIRLPSGRYLCYPAARLEPKGSFAYKGILPGSYKWDLIYSHGGKVVENIVQAAARDVLAHGLLKAEEAGLRPVLHTHDEIICETPITIENADALLVECMTEVPEWATGLPLSAVGFEADRYCK